jgi:AcrR family transcriptional regulator
MEGIAMTKDRNDLRIRNTKKRLRTTIAQLMSEKPIQNITVAELCAKAEINRSTFYAHYSDIYDLQQKLEQEIYAEFQATLAQVDLEGSSSPDNVPIFMVTMFGFLKRNADMCAVFLGPHSDRKFVMNLLDIAKETTIDQYGRAYKKASAHQLELFYTFIAYGCIGLLEYWMKNGFSEPVEEMARLTNQMIMLGASFLEG